MKKKGRGQGEILAGRLEAALADKARQTALGQALARLLFYLGADAEGMLAKLVMAEGEVSGWLYRRGRDVDAALEPGDLAQVVRETMDGFLSLRFARAFHSAREAVRLAGGARVNERGTILVPRGVPMPKVPSPLRVSRFADPVASERAALAKTMEALRDTGAAVGPETILRAADLFERHAQGALLGAEDRALRRIRAKGWDALEAQGIVATSVVPSRIRRKVGRPRKTGQKARR